MSHPNPVVTRGSGVPETPQEPLHDHVFGVRCRSDCPRWGNPVPQPGWETPQDWFFTFGGAHTHPTTGQSLRNSFVRIHGTCDSTREEMFAAFGRHWAFQYSTAEKPLKIDRYGMVEVPMPGQEPAAEDDDEQLREAYAQDELDQDRVPTEAGFAVWKSQRRAVGQGEPPATPAEARTGISDVQAAVVQEVAKVRRLINAYGIACDALGASTEARDIGVRNESIAVAQQERRELFAALDRIEALAGGGRR